MSVRGVHAPRSGLDRTWLIALAASLWGTSALMREPLLGQGIPPGMIVLCEHVILATCTLPWLVHAVPRIRAAGRGAVVSALVLGAGSSALATTMFTAAFSLGDPITPQVLQKLQPLVALLLAGVLLGERLRSTFLWFALPALVGAWLLAFPDPLGITTNSARAALLAVGAATLWGAGTVLGRRLSGIASPAEVASLRFSVGLVAMTIIVTWRGEWMIVPARSVPLLLALAAVPGLIALLLYYFGLRSTAASRATLAELAFPVTAAVVGVLWLDGRLSTSQWIGGAVVVIAVSALALNERSDKGRPAVIPGYRGTGRTARSSAQV